MESRIDINMTTEQRIEVMVKTIRDFVNTSSRNSAEFNKLMSVQHRTLQQSFTALCLKWIGHMAKDEYHTDLRNEYSRQTAMEIVAAMEKLRGYDFEIISNCPLI
jgi:hypothetical protein